VAAIAIADEACIIFLSITIALNNYDNQGISMTKLTFTAIRADQSNEHMVMCFTATASEISIFSTIERIARDDEGRLSGFQRPKLQHIFKR